MVFSSTVFLFLFLPVVLGLYVLLPRMLRNLFLLLASLLFYAWGETWYVALMLASAAVNYGLGIAIERWREVRAGRVALIAAVVLNLAGLAAFKYANFVAANLSLLSARYGWFPPVALAPVHLPIGISFFTFHGLSYVIDVYRKQAAAQRNPITAALYIALFPQLVAGPIIRYSHIAGELVTRKVTSEDFAYGIRRFTVGLAKKVLIANTVAVAADGVFALPPWQLTTGLAWLGVVCYTLQIYFDFSGYSDMAIGLGRMFGFHIRENFNYPYASQSIREFWRRWHISLSTWFRDYLYIPLGGSRRSTPRVYFNLTLTFLLCGLWHGASWTFVIWGLYHGVFLVLERTRFGKRADRAWAPLRHVYVLLVVMVGWTLFRAESLTQVTGLLRAMVGLAPGTGVQYYVAQYANRELILALVLGGLGSVPLCQELAARWRRRLAESLRERPRLLLQTSLAYAGACLHLLLLVLCATYLSAGTYNPFIYFRF
jgi:alginate O-acetyltransferase complex protein AlgI